MSCCNETLDCLNKLGEYPHNANVELPIPLIGGTDYEIYLRDSKNDRRIELIQLPINQNLIVKKEWLNESMAYTFRLYDLANGVFIQVNNCNNFQFTTFINNSVF